VEQLLFLRGFIASPTFSQHTMAMDAASDILELAFGKDMARPARSSIGASSLPSGGLSEIELTVAVAPS
jgi:enamine deaminase RidA (YjgF/YER057c/UK114 family)